MTNLKAKAKQQKRLTYLLSKYNVQQNPIILREISVCAFKLMNYEREDIVCCKVCNEPGFPTSYAWLQNNTIIEIYNSHSSLRCDNSHTWEHHWAIGDRFCTKEHVDQCYVYECVKKHGELRFEFKRINGTRHYPGSGVDYEDEMRREQGGLE